MGDWISIGGGSSSSSGQSATQVQLTPEQQALLKAQTDAYTNIFLPNTLNLNFFKILGLLRLTKTFSGLKSP
jgi:hypothetical protein